MSDAAVEKWGVFEAAFAGPSEGNPYLDVAFDAVFTHKSREVRVPGFYDGNGTYRIRFMPGSKQALPIVAACWSPATPRIGIAAPKKPGSTVPKSSALSLTSGSSARGMRRILRSSSSQQFSAML